MEQLKQRFKQIIKFIASKFHRKNKFLILLIVFIVFYGIYRIPVVFSRVNNKVDEISTNLTYYFNPPEDAVFIPQDQFQIALIVQATLAAMTPEVTPSATATLLPNEPTSVPTITSTPLPQKVILDNITYVDQRNRWNYCGPANITMALNYWGWGGNRDDVAKVIKPGENDPDLSFIDRGKSDKNVMPYELSNYVRDFTNLNAVLRIGGDMELLKNLISNGYPVIIEKGYYEDSYFGGYSWMGHYLFVTGFDDERGTFIVQDAFLEPGKNVDSDYENFETGWHSFNYTFIVVYPPENENEVFEILGPWGSVNWANQHALDLADQDIANNPEGYEAYFSWFNKGSSHVALDQYHDAAIAYDFSFYLYSQLDGEEKLRPYRMLWYQVGPYWAYYYTERYDDLINLASTTLDETLANPELEESLYWRGWGYLEIGQYEDAVDDFQEAVYLNPNYSSARSILIDLGEDISD